MLVGVCAASRTDTSIQDSINLPDVPGDLDNSKRTIKSWN